MTWPVDVGKVLDGHTLSISKRHKIQQDHCSTLRSRASKLSVCLVPSPQVTPNAKDLHASKTNSPASGCCIPSSTSGGEVNNNCSKATCLTYSLHLFGAHLPVVRG